MSVAPAELVESGLAKIDDDLAFLMECLREVLVSLGEDGGGFGRGVVACEVGGEGAVAELLQPQECFGLAAQRA